jgi:hypothetical protein
VRNALDFLLAAYFLNAVVLWTLAGLLEKAGRSAKARGEMTSLAMPRSLVEGFETVVVYGVMLALPQHARAVFLAFGAAVAAGVAHRFAWAHWHVQGPNPRAGRSMARKTATDDKKKKNVKTKTDSKTKADKKTGKAAASPRRRASRSRSRG